MQDLLEQIKRGLDANLYYLSLFVALTIPDICGAMESEDGKAHSSKYKAWFDNYVVKRDPNKYGNGNNFTSDDCYHFRCAILHQGCSQHGKISYCRILFFEPPSPIPSIHACMVDSKSECPSLLINVEKFCTDIIEAAYDWLKEKEETEIYKKNYSKLIKRYPKGIKPVLGCPVIG